MTAVAVIQGRMPADEQADEHVVALVLASRSGDRAALEALLILIERRVYTLAYRLMGDAAAAEDVAQDVFLKICRQIGRYRGGGGNFWPWVYRIVVNQVHDHRRAESRQPGSTFALETISGPELLHPARDEQHRRVLAAMNGLTGKERTALVLIDVEGFSSTEAARILGCWSVTARTRAAQARKKIRRALSRYYPELREAK